MAIDIRLANNSSTKTATLILDGQLDAVGSPILERSVNKIMTPEIETVILDLTDLSFISSAGLRMFAKMKKLMKNRGGRFLFVNAQPQVRKVFDIVKAVKVSEIFASYAELDEYLEKIQNEEEN
ncbi:hypothetical protein TI04_07335 [Achromatium sp. WMS2]|nr:hypothetical protein TI04_07335 [Achromatium sp. WMS2]